MKELLMKKELILGLSIGLVVGILIMFIGGKVLPNNAVGAYGKSNVSLALPEIDKMGPEHLVKVENYGITIDDFTNAYDLVKKNLPPEQQATLLSNESAAKAEILETMINQYAVVATAIEEGFLENPKTLQMFRNAAQQALFNLYINENMPQGENAFAVSQPEIEQAFAQYGNELRARGMNATQSQEFLSAQIAQQKRQRWMFEFVSKIKEGFRVERNSEAIKSQDISTSRTGFSPQQPQP